MTIIYAHISDDSHILVADRKLTRADGTTVAEDEYKIILYKNIVQGYEVGVAFTGLARGSNSHNTSKWLLDILPTTLIDDVSLGAGLDKFAAACTNCFARLSVPPPKKATTFVFCGTFFAPGGSRESFIALVSNAMDERGEQIDKVSQVFRVQSWTRNDDAPNGKHWLSIVRGDLRSARPERAKLLRLMRQHRRRISAQEKVRITIPVLRAIATHGTSVGETFLSLAFQPDGNVDGSEWAPDDKATTSMPHLLYSSGTGITEIKLCTSGSLVDELITHRNDPDKVNTIIKKMGA